MYSTTKIMMPMLLNRNAVKALQWSLARSASGGFSTGTTRRRIDRFLSIFYRYILLSRRF